MRSERSSTACRFMFGSNRTDRSGQLWTAQCTTAVSIDWPGPYRLAGHSVEGSTRIHPRGRLTGTTTRPSSCGW